MNVLTVPKDVIALPQGEDRWVIYNVFTRTCVGTEGAAVEFLGRLHNSEEGSLKELNAEVKYYVWEVGYFSNSQGLMHDPSRFMRDRSKWPVSREVNGGELIKILKEKYLILTDQGEYRSRFGPMRSMLDQGRFGNFHQQLGMFLMTKRETAEAFWYRQKFTVDFKQVRNNLYRAVQERFLRAYIPGRFSDPKLKVLDLACGTGYYTNMIGRAGASVVGVDINAESLSIARRNAPQNVFYYEANVRDEDSLGFFGDKSIDIVFVSDALLFYFCPLCRGDDVSAGGFFGLARRVLKPWSTLIILEPHYLFWLAPWFGEEEYPFTVFTEYMNRRFLVTPSFSRVFQEASKGGFALKWMEELAPDQEFEAVDKRAYHFAREFPLWHLFEFIKIRNE